MVVGPVTFPRRQPPEELTVVIGRAVDEEELLALEQPRLGGEVGVLVSLGVVEWRGEAEVALGVDGVVVDPVGDRRHRDPALEDVLSVLRQHGQRHEACNG